MNDFSNGSWLGTWVLREPPAASSLYESLQTNTPKVRIRRPCWPRSWAGFSLLSLYSHLNVWANLHFLGHEPYTFLA
jgi:hypothetical protein